MCPARTGPQASLSHLLAEQGPGVLLHRFVDDLAEIFVRPVAPGQARPARNWAAGRRWPGRRSRASASCGPGRPVTQESPPHAGPAMRGIRLSRLSRNGFCHAGPVPLVAVIAAASSCPCVASGSSPRFSNFVDAFVLQHQERQWSSQYRWPTTAGSLLRRLGGAADGVPGDHAVVGDGFQRLLRHSVHRVGGDQFGDVQNCPSSRVLDAGRGPQRPLQARTP